MYLAFSFYLGIFKEITSGVVLSYTGLHWLEFLGTGDKENNNTKTELQIIK